MLRKTIAVDIDDVLSLTAEGFIAHTNKLFGHTLSRDDYQDDWAKMWGVPLEEAMRRAAVIHEKHDHIAQYGSVDNALPVLQRLGKEYRLIVVTARRLVTKELSERWLQTHFPGIFSDIRYAGIWDDTDNVLERVEKSKADFYKELGADYVIDDQLKHCLGAAGYNIPALLFGDYRWARTTEALPPLVTKVYNWQQVEEYFDGQSRC